MFYTYFDEFYAPFEFKNVPKINIQLHLDENRAVCILDNTVSVYLAYCMMMHQKNYDLAKPLKTLAPKLGKITVLSLTARTYAVSEYFHRITLTEIRKQEVKKIEINTHMIDAKR